MTLVLRADHDLAEDSDEDELWEEDSDEAMEGRRQRFADEALRRAGLVRRLPLRSQAGWPSPPSAPARGRLLLEESRPRPGAERLSRALLCHSLIQKRN